MLNPETIAASLHDTVQLQLTSLPSFAAAHMTAPGYPVLNNMTRIMQTVDVLTEVTVHDDDIETMAIAVQAAMKVAGSDCVSLAALMDAIDVFTSAVRCALDAAAREPELPF